jgi:DNA excision repair protein ERCC-2
MFSADLESNEISALHAILDNELPTCARVLRKIGHELSHPSFKEPRGEQDGVFVLEHYPEGITDLLQQFLDEAESWLVQNLPSSFRQSLLDFYFHAHAFLRTCELYDEHYVTLHEPKAGRLRLFCLDASVLIQKALQRGRSSIFFSATLQPIDYFQETLGGGVQDAVLRLASPFPPENLAVLIQDTIATDYKARGSTYDAVAHAIGALVQQKSGNYLAYFPSYQYLAQVLERFQVLYPGIAILAQTPRMKERQREEFLAEFHSEPAQTLVGFAIMGGLFGEGIDLAGERLVGAAVIGVGLPQLCLERDLIREYYQEKKGLGFNYAYTFPGINRVLQAVGRVIRSSTDRGVILLIDQRFARQPYRSLLPSWWHPQTVRDPGKIALAAKTFWSLPDL